MLYSAPCLNLSSNFFRHIVHAFVVMLFSAFWATTAFAVPTSPSIITFSQTKTTHFAQGTDVNFAARAPPMAMPNVKVAGGVTVMQGSAFALHGQETVAALFNFDANLVAPNTALTATQKQGILREASQLGQGNLTLPGRATRAEVAELGQAWVGPGHRVASDGSTLVSADGLRTFRPPTPKPNSQFSETGVQVNFETRELIDGRWTVKSNAHLDVSD
jgi:hypothetical protein